jgi:site-specific DNA recombinase
MVDLMDILEVVQPTKTQIATVRAGNMDLSTPTGQMMAEIMASVAQYEGKAKSDRWRRSVRQRREAGQIPKSGPRLFGYARDGAIIPEEAGVIKWLASSLIDGEPLHRVTVQLNDMGLLTTLGNQWSRTTVRGLMSNGRLAGRSMMNGDAVGVGQWEPILDAETFEQVQAALSVRRGTVPRRPRVALLLGLIRCSECDTPLRSGRRESRKGKQGKRVYKCPTQPGEDGCGGVTIDALGVEEIVEEYARAKLDDPMVREQLALLADATGDKTAEVIGLEERLKELEQQLDQPGVPVPTIMRAMDRTRERIETLRASMVTVPTRLPTGDWPDALALRVRLVQLVVAGVVVSPASRGGNTLDQTRVEIEPRRLV